MVSLDNSYLLGLLVLFPFIYHSNQLKAEICHLSVKFRDCIE